MNEQVQKLKQNIDPKIVVSGIVTMFAGGALLWVLNKSNVKALKSVASIAKGGK